MEETEPSVEREAHEVLPLIYEELRALARHRLGSEKPGQTLQPTALVHEAYLRLAQSEKSTWKSRRYFFAAAAEAMRRILIDRARAKLAQRRGSGVEVVELEEAEIAAPMPEDELLALDDALDKFSECDAVKAELVKLKFFAGLSTLEAANVLDISEPTAKRYWAFARAWLSREMTREA